MVSVEEFKARVRANQLEALLDEVLLADEASHVSPQNILKIKSALSAKYSVAAERIFVRVVGSAKLGFSMVEKRTIGGQILQRYRPFSPESDVDVVVINSEIFDLIWNDLSLHAHRSARLPWDSGALGDYLICGWLRPDHFPNKARLRRCDDWWDVFRQLSADATFGRRKIRGGLFHSLDQARSYLIRALADCARAEAMGT